MNAIFLDAFQFTPISLQFPVAWVGHIPFAMYLSKRFRPHCFVELGTHYGNSYFAFCQALKAAHVNVAAYAVDTWKGDTQATFYSEDVFAYVSKHNEEHYAGFSTLLRMTFDEAVSNFSDGSIDLLHIDGCHTYEAVKHDFETWFPKLASGAVILFHDINVHLPGYGVWQFWEEMQGRYKDNFSFFHSNGLGVLQLSGGTPEKNLDFLSLEPEKQQEFRDVFSVLGTTHQYRYRQDQLLKEVDALHRMMAERETAMIHQSGVIAEKDAVLAEHERLFAYKDAVIAEKERRLAETHAAVAHLENTLHGVLNSRSWRLTSPLRAMISFLKKPALK